MRPKPLTLILAALFCLAAADVPEDRGIAGLSQALDRLDVVGSVLHTGAHPDDEDSSLLAWLSRGQGVRTAYLSVTRGEGGQNRIGSELFEALGVIRTEELLAARRFDRAEQFFTPNYEFGFSKTAAEALDKWGRRAIDWRSGSCDSPVPGLKSLFRAFRHATRRAWPSPGGRYRDQRGLRRGSGSRAVSPTRKALAGQEAIRVGTR